MKVLLSLFLTSTMAEKDTQPMSQNTQDSQNVAPTEDSFASWALLFWIGKPDKDTERLRLGKDAYTVGRGAASDIVLTQDNCKIKMENLSRIHFSFKRIADMTGGYQTMLEDYSSNGTYVNNVKIGKGKSKLLCHADEISLTCRNEKVFTYLDAQYKHPGFPIDISKRYLIVNSIGKGAFGEVWLAVQLHSNKRFAIKSVRRQGKAHGSGIDAFDQLKNEADLLCTLEHPNIVKVEEIVCRPNSIHLILELMSGGDLQGRIRGKSQLKESTAKYYFYQLAMAVQYFHSQDIVHRDLKPENILLSSNDEDAILKITDFGLSKLVDENTMLQTYCGTPLYLAPEVVEAKCHKSPYTSSVDVWSLGVILFLLLSGYHPFVHSKPLEKLIVKADYKLRKDRWGKVSADGLSLVKCILQVDPKNRPSMEDIFNHPWMLDVAVIEKVRKLVLGSESPASSQVLSVLSSTSREENFNTPLSKRRRI